MKKIFLLSFLVLGLSSLIAQVTILRELMVSFYGNEFFIGWLLAVWVCWVALGSFLIGKANFKNESAPKSFYILTFVLTPFLLILGVILIRHLNNFNAIAGQIANLLPALLGSLILPAPLCLNLGAQFSLATKTFRSNQNSITVSQIYLWESLGFVVGGVMFSFWLVNLNIFFSAALLGLINALIAFLFLYFFFPQKLALKILSLVLFFVFFGSFFLAQKIDEKTLAWRFWPQKLLASINSRFAHLAVTEIKSQYNFYENGLLLGNDLEIPNNEYLAHLSLLFHPQPKNVLLVGGGFNGLMNELLKHPVEKITYLELDEEFIKLIYRFAPEEIKTGLKDSRVKIINADALSFFKNHPEKFDVILINLPSPATALINRFYTQEFFELASQRLNPEALLVTQLPFSPEYQNDELIRLNHSLYQTLKTVFSHLLILPEDNNIFIASQKDIAANPKILAERFKTRQIKTHFLTKSFIYYRLTNERIALTLNSFSQQKETQINKNFQPIAYFYNLNYWLTYFHPRIGSLVSKISQFNFWWFLAAVFLIALIFSSPKQKRSERTLVFNMAVFGFLIMAGEIIFLFLFQSVFGYLYEHLALLLAILMAGLAVGTWRGSQIIQTRNINIFSVFRIQMALIVFLPLCFWLGLPNLPDNQTIALLIFYSFIFTFSFLAGFGFPYLNHLYLKNKKDPKINLSLLYSADLVGAASGALLPALIFLPLFGLNQTVFLIGVIIVSGSLLLFLAKNSMRTA